MRWPFSGEHVFLPARVLTAWVEHGIAPRARLQESVAISAAVAVVYLVALLSTSFAVPNLLRNVRGTPPIWTFLLPSSWFVGLCQSLRGAATPALTTLGHLTFPAVIAVSVIALCAYAIGYRLSPLPPNSRTLGSMSAGAPSHLSPLYRYLDRLVLRTPFQKAGFRFVWKTLLRSEAHRLLLTGTGGLGLVLASRH